MNYGDRYRNVGDHFHRICRINRERSNQQAFCEKAANALDNCSAEELYAAIRAVARGQVLLLATSAAQLLAGLPPTLLPSSPQPQSAAEKLGLTERERDVLRLIVQGHNNSEIAAELYVSEATVKTHINHIFAKLGARDRVHAVVLAHQLGLA